MGIESTARRKFRFLAAAIVATVLAAAARDARAQGRIVTWTGANGNAWEDNLNWTDDDPDTGPLQPFDIDAVIIPSGTPVITFIEGINTLNVHEDVSIANNGVLTVHNGVVNNGLMTVADDGQVIMEFGPFTGGGEIVLADSKGTFAALQGAPFGHTPCCMTHPATHTIRGEGVVTGKWVNDGLIRAEETSGDEAAVLTLNGTMTNNGVIRSSATGALNLESFALTMESTGQLIADGQPIWLSTVTINGGSIDATGGAKFVRRPDVGGFTVLSGVTLNGDFDVLVNNAGVQGIGTGFTNNGTMTIDNLGVANGELNLAAGATLGGTGQVVLNRASDNVHVSGTFTHGANHTIRGAGRIHANITNNGSILAEPKTGGGLLRVVGNAITNNNLLQANSGATLRLEQQVAITQGVAGRIRAADGGRVELRDNAVVNGGKLQTAGTGLIVNTTASVLNNVTNEGEFHALTGTTTRVNTTLINNGTITINPSGVAGITTLEFSTDTVLSGTGTIVLNQAGNSANISSAQSNQDITQAAGHTIRGGGRISSGYFGDGRFINNGRMEGNSSAQPLVIQAKLSGRGALKDVQIGGDGFGVSHTLAEAGTTAVVAVEGLYNFVALNSMLFDLAGASPGTGYDQLNSTGPITISSTQTRLEVSLAGGFRPMPGQSFTLLTTTGALTGNFGTVSLPPLATGLAWTQTQTATSLSIGVTGSLAADFDEDGDVDADDLVRWKAGHGTGTLHTQGDADGDLDVDGVDFMAWQRSLGWGVAATAVAAAVPEPGAACLLLAAAIFWGRISGVRRGIT